MSDAERDVAPTERVSLAQLDGDGRQSLFESEPKTVRLALDADEAIPPHQHPDRDVVLHLLTGELTLELGAETLSLSADDVVRFDGNQDISPQAETACEALLVLAPSP